MKSNLAVVAAALACSCSPVTLDESETAMASTGSWFTLGDELVLDPSAWVQGPALAGDGDLLALSENDASYVRAWTGAEWSNVGAPLPGYAPALATGGAKAGTYACWIDGTYVHASRWNGSAWTEVGSDAVDVLALGADTIRRYYANTCAIAVVGNHPIVAWSAHLGSKYDLAYAATYASGSHTWKLMGTADGIGSDRAVDARLTVDAGGDPIVATFEPGGSYGGGATTRVYIYRGEKWVQLGGEAGGTSYPQVAASSTAVYLALVAGDYAHGTDRVHVYQGTFTGKWRELPNTFSQHGDDVPALALSSGELPVLAFARAPGMAVYSYDGAAWSQVGTAIAGSGNYVTGSALALSDTGVATVAWLEQTFGEAASSSVKAVRLAP